VSRQESGHLALIGLSGSGKSTLAPLLASRTGIGAAMDLDREIERRVGRPVAEIFEHDGESAFRVAECDALRDVLAGPPCVLATGGGVVLDAGNRALLRSAATVIWLRATVGELEVRLADTTEARPLLDGDVGFALGRLAAEREALYAEVADVVVDVDGASVDELLDELLDRIGIES
jgi:shikimate kinase